MEGRGRAGPAATAVFGGRPRFSRLALPSEKGRATGRMAGGGANEHATVAPNPDPDWKSQFGLSGGRGMGRVR